MREIVREETGRATEEIEKQKEKIEVEKAEYKGRVIKMIERAHLRSKRE